MKKHIMPLVVILLFGCSKDQITVNKLDGSWDMKSLTINGSPYQVVSGGWKFEKCKQSKGDCEGSYNVTFMANGYPVTSAATFEYEVKDKGTEMELLLSFATYTDNTEADIDLDKDDLEIEYTEFDGTRVSMELERD